METIKVKRSAESKGRCKLAWNKVYNAEINTFNKDSYIIGSNAYLSKWFTPVTDNQPKSKPVVTTDPKTGKFKVKRDWSVPQAFPRGYAMIPGTEVVLLESIFDIEIGTRGIVLENSPLSYIYWEDGKYKCDDLSALKINGGRPATSDVLAPLNPTDHPEHPDFGKAKVQQEPIQNEPEPTDIRDTIADYIKKYGNELTAIELIGHLTIDRR